DGIRDGHVTGVQTCALPISQSAAVNPLAVLFFDRMPVAPPAVIEPELVADADGRRGARAVETEVPINILSSHGNEKRVIAHALRSEERRVGKECRARWGECV